MKTIIVDDEPKAIELIKSYASHFSFLEIVGTFRNGLKAIEYIESNQVELIILDINMPHLSGIALAKLLTGTKVNIIFTTAYSEFALESYEVEALDYLLKPVSLERFAKAVTKLIKHSESEDKTNKYLHLKSSGNVYRVLPDEILYLQKLGNYMEYLQADKKILVRESTTEALQNLPSYFIQIHKSYIINVRKVAFFNKEEVSIAGAILPVGAIYKAAFLEAFKES